MTEAPLISPELYKPEFQISPIQDGFGIRTPHIDLSSESRGYEFEVTLEKLPTEIYEGANIDGIIIERESTKLREMLAEAESLKDIPDHEKPRKLLEIVRRNISYPYDETIEEIAATDPTLAEWISRNTGPKSQGYNPVSVSKIVDTKHGVCRHLSVVTLMLAKEANMEGAYLTTSSPLLGTVKSDSNTLMNVINPKTGEALFKSASPNAPVLGGHAWVELKTKDGTWIPLDPTTQLVGDSPEELETFRKANYNAWPGSSLNIEGFPNHVDIEGNQDLWFAPSKSIHTGIVTINSRVEQIISITKGPDGKLISKSEEPKQTQYSGPLNFQIYSRPAERGITVAVKNVSKAKADQN